jgi:hypothetical protein
MEESEKVRLRIWACKSRAMERKGDKVKYTDSNKSHSLQARKMKRANNPVHQIFTKRRRDKTRQITHDRKSRYDTITTASQH